MKLVIETYGARISFDTGVLVIETEDKTQEISMLHISSIHILKQARISSSVIVECIKSGIPVYFENDMKIEGMLWSPRYGSIAKIRKKQALFSYSKHRYKLIKRLLIRKNEERLKFIRKHTVKPGILQEAEKILKLNSQLEEAPNNDNIIRSIEGNTSKLYFNLYNTLLPAPYRFAKRTYKKSKDLLNQMLNYAYGMLYNEVSKSLIVAGLDPDLGFFHVPQYGKPGLAFDTIEPYRVWAEQSVYKTIKNKEFQKIENPADENARLTKPAKRLLITEMTTWMKEHKINWNKRIKTPQTHIQLDAHNLAQYILKYSETELLEDLCQSYKKNL